MSITNARQYRISKAQLARFEQAIESAERARGEPRTGQESIAHDVLLEQARAQADDLRRELEDYERIAGSQTMTLEVHSLSDLPTALIHARMASGLTQRELAQRIGVTPQQVQRDEQTGYAQASLERLQRVWQVLGASLDGRVTLSQKLDPPDEWLSDQPDSASDVEEGDRLSRTDQRTIG